MQTTTLRTPDLPSAGRGPYPRYFVQTAIQGDLNTPRPSRVQAVTTRSRELCCNTPRSDIRLLHHSVWHPWQEQRHDSHSGEQIAPLCNSSSVLVKEAREQRSSFWRQSQRTVSDWLVQLGGLGGHRFITRRRKRQGWTSSRRKNNIFFRKPSEELIFYTSLLSAVLLFFYQQLKKKYIKMVRWKSCKVALFKVSFTVFTVLLLVLNSMLLM